MQVQSQPQAVVLPQANPAPFADVAAKTTRALLPRYQDGFDQVPVDPNTPSLIDCLPPSPSPVAGELGMQDRLTSMKLKQALTNPLNAELLASGSKDVVLARDILGAMRGPEGQPLAAVSLRDGTSAYVDPNTNQYFLTDEPESGAGMTHAMGPLDLPEIARFTNSYFSGPEVRTVEKLAASDWPFPGPVADPVPQNPGPLPPLPLPFPQPRIPEDWLGRI